MVRHGVLLRPRGLAGLLASGEWCWQRAAERLSIAPVATLHLTVG